VETTAWKRNIGATMGSQLHISEFSTLANNPQSVRVLANEWLACSIGRASVSRTAPIASGIKRSSKRMGGRASVSPAAAPKGAIFRQQ